MATAVHSLRAPTPPLWRKNRNGSGTVVINTHNIHTPNVSVHHQKHFIFSRFLMLFSFRLLEPFLFLSLPYFFLPAHQSVSFLPPFFLYFCLIPVLSPFVLLSVFFPSSFLPCLLPLLFLLYSYLSILSLFLSILPALFLLSQLLTDRSRTIGTF